MTPLEALQAGTISPARSLGMEADVGSLEPASSPTWSSSTPIPPSTSATARRSSG
jgi:hypothetical protein